MKITISKNDLKDALDKASATLGKGEDITSHFLFSATETGVEVLSCDPPRMFSSSPLIGAKVEEGKSEEGKSEEGKSEEKKSEEGKSEEKKSEFTVDGKRILQAINSIDGVITLSHSEGDVTLESSKGSLVFSSLNPINFPPWSKMLKEAKLKNEEEIKVTTTTLNETLHNLKPYCSQNEQRHPELCMVLFKGGKAFACDGFGLAMAKNDTFENIDLKIHFKDLSPLSKFLKAHDGEPIKIKEGEKATFLSVEDGSTIGFMHIPFDMPNKITTQYSEAFEWTPRRVWKFKKQELLNAISFLSSGASDQDHKVKLTDPESEEFNSPNLEMEPSSGKGVLSYSIDNISFKKEDDKEIDLTLIEDLGERMWINRHLLDGEEENPDIEEFYFNALFMKRALDVISSEEIIFGCNQENAKRGYMVFKNLTPNGVDIASVVGWIV